MSFEIQFIFLNVFILFLAEILVSLPGIWNSGERLNKEQNQYL